MEQQAGGTIHSNKTVMGLPVNKEFMFANLKGVEKKGIKKRQLSLLKKLDFLPRFLKQGEEVYLVTTACSPISLLEQLTTGWIIFYIKRSLLVFTNKRILHIPTTPGYKFRHSIAQINFNDCQSMKLSWGSLKIQYKNKKKENFLYINRKERKKIKHLIQKINLKAEPSKHQQRYHLCPSCMRSLKAGIVNCASCRLEFKSRSRAQLLSFLVPGGGYFYTGHWFLGLSDFLVEAGLIFLAISAYTDPSPGDTGPITTASVFLFVLVIEKLITVYHATHYVREFIPVNTKYKKRAIA